MPHAAATAQMRDWLAIYGVTPGPTPACLLAAAAAATAGSFQFFDALLLATAGEAGCMAVISEDMHPGATLNGVRVVAAFDAAGGIGADALTLLTT